jgi:hypothetical protein
MIVVRSGTSVFGHQALTANQYEGDTVAAGRGCGTALINRRPHPPLAPAQHLLYAKQSQPGVQTQSTNILNH